jgi:hypothetical protein
MCNNSKSPDAYRESGAGMGVNENIAFSNIAIRTRNATVRIDNIDGLDVVKLHEFN